MGDIYFDNASTTFPKPQSVPDAVYQYMIENGCNIGRGGYGKAYEAEKLVYETRKQLKQLFCGDDIKNVVFTKNITESMNILLKGLLKPHDHVLVSSMEHNAVMRPLTQLAANGVSFTRVPCNMEGVLELEQLEGCLTKQTRAVVMTHASNVCGTILPIEKAGMFCKEHGLLFIVDSAQTAGLVNIDMQTMHIDALGFTGHKGLLGPQGTGGFLIKNELALQITPLLSGGTGSISHTEEVPEFMPDRFEPGTMNLPGIAGLHAGLNWLSSTGTEQILYHEQELCGQFLNGLTKLEQDSKVKIIGKHSTTNRVGVVSIQTLHMDIARVSHVLEQTYGIMTRVGLHCAPSAHKTLGTFPTGTIRFSFGWWNTKEEITIALKALEEILYGA